MANPFKSHPRLWIAFSIASVITIGGLIFCGVKVADHLSSTPILPSTFWPEVLPLLADGNEKKAGHLLKSEFALVDAEKSRAVRHKEAALSSMKLACDEMRQAIGETSFCYSTLLMELADMESAFGEREESQKTMKKALAAMPKEGTEAFATILRERLIDMLSRSVEENAKEIIALRQQNLVAAEGLYSKNHKNSELLTKALENLYSAQEENKQFDDAGATLNREVQVIRDGAKDPWALPTCLSNLGRVQLKGGHYDLGESSLRNSLEGFEKLAKDPSSSDRANSWIMYDYDLLGKLFFRRHQIAEAEKYLRQAVGLSSKAGWRSLSCDLDLACVLRSQGRFADSEKLLADAVNRAEHPPASADGKPAFPVEPEEINRALVDLAVSAALRGDRDQAMKYYAKWSSKSYASFDSVRSSAGIWVEDFAALNKRGVMPKAARGLEIVKRQPSRNNMTMTFVEYSFSMQNLKCLLQGIAVPVECVATPFPLSQWQKQLKNASDVPGRDSGPAALKALNSALACAEKFTPGDSRLAYTLSLVGQCNAGLSKDVEAEKYYTQALEAQSKEPVEYRCPVSNGLVLRELGRTMHRQKKYSEAGEILSKALAVLEAALGKENDAVQSCCVELASNLIAQGKLDDAKALYQRVLVGGFSYDKPDFYARGRAKVGLSYIFLKQGRYGQAEIICHEMLDSKYQPPPDLHYRALKVYADVLRQEGKLSDSDKRLFEAKKLRSQLEEAKDDFGLDDW